MCILCELRAYLCQKSREFIIISEGVVKWRKLYWTGEEMGLRQITGNIVFVLFVNLIMDTGR